MPLQEPDAGAGHSFALDVDGLQVVGITDVRLTMEMDVVEVEENGPDGTLVVKRLPGRPRAPGVTLTRRLSHDRALDDWVAAARTGDVRRDGALSVVDLEGAVVKRYRLTGAWPTKLEVGSSEAGGRAVLVETLVLLCDRLEVE